MWVPASPFGFPSSSRNQKELANIEIMYIEKTHKNTKINNKTHKNNTKSHKINKLNRYSTMAIFSANAAGMARKSLSLTHELKECNATIFSIQETNYKKKGKYSNNEYEVFEALRQNKEKGGTMLGIHKSLNPVLVEEYSETFELIVAEVKVMDKEIKVMSGYGPQEEWKDADKMPFFALEEEISKAAMAGKSIIIELDANSKLGPSYIENYPKSM